MIAAYQGYVISLSILHKRAWQDVSGVKVPAVKPNELSLISGTYRVEGDNGSLQVVL